MNLENYNSIDLINDFIPDHQVGQFDDEGNTIGEMIVVIPESDYDKLRELINKCCSL